MRERQEGVCQKLRYTFKRPVDKNLFTTTYLGFNKGRVVQRRMELSEERLDCVVLGREVTEGFLCSVPLPDIL